MFFDVLVLHPILRWRLFDLWVNACSQSYYVACLDFDVKIRCFRENEDSLRPRHFIIRGFIWILFDNYLSMFDISRCLIPINIFCFVMREQQSPCSTTNLHFYAYSLLLYFLNFFVYIYAYWRKLSNLIEIWKCFRLHWSKLLYNPVTP